jgi:hypothetical protein
MPKIGATDTSRQARGADAALHGADAALHGADAALSRVLGRRRKPFERDNLRHLTALTALGR